MTRIACVSLTSCDPQRLAAFYAEAFGFQLTGKSSCSGTAFERLMAIDGGRAEAFRMRLGDQKIELVAFSPPGAAYPTDMRSDDSRFQHFAIVVTNMAAAYARLQKCGGWSTITRSEPQKLPESSGGVTAFKFRDPEGHPLELLAFPRHRTPPQWANAPAGICIGIDHSAIVVASTALSVQFYTALLGFDVSNRSINEGEKQARLDALPRPFVEVTALASGEQKPHLELLCYKSDTAASVSFTERRANDLVDTRLVLDTDDLPQIVQRLTAANATFVSGGVINPAGGASAALIRDPDGHAILLVSGKSSEPLQ